MRGAFYLCVLLLAACDSKATASDPAGATKPEQKSKEFETCGATAHCAEDLRCLDHVCRRMQRSTIGDYWAAVGAAAHGRGEHDAAIEAYDSAVRQYGADKIPSVPPDIDCGLGAALAGGKAKPENAERAAQALHKCLLAVPAGSSLREHALAELATLADYGLQPVALGATKPGEQRYTKAVEPKAPSTDKVSITVTADQQPKAFGKIQDKIMESKAALVECWEAHNKATKKDTVTATVGMKSYFYQDPNYADEEGGGFVLNVDMGGGGGTEVACVRKAIESGLKQLRFGEAFNSKITVTIK